MICLPKFELSRNSALFTKQGRVLFIAAFIAMGLAFITTTAYAATPRYVQTGKIDAGDCSTPISACATITYALGQASAGDEIKVAAGTYTEAEITVNKAVTITGGFDVNGPTNWNSSNFTTTPSILDGGDAHRLLYITSDKAVVQFMTVQHGNSTLSGNHPGEGGGIAVAGVKNVILRGLTVLNNSTSVDANSTGGGVALLGESSLTIDRSLILSNTATGLGGGVGLRPATGELASLEIDASVVAHNNAPNGGAFGGSGEGRSGISTNFVTMADNGTAPESIYFFDGSNTATKQDFLTFQFVLTRGNPTIVTNAANLEPTMNFNGLMADPSITTPYAGFTSSFPPPVFRQLTFVNGPKGNYHLPKGSPAIDILGAVEKTDLDGRVRDIGLKQCTPFYFCPLGLGSDYGAYEYVYTAPSVRYVALEGSDQENNCLNPDTPCKSLGRASRFALGGDEIRLTRGTHTLSDGGTICNNRAIICILQGITLTGGFTTTNWNTPSTNPALTVLDGGGVRQGIRVDYDAPLGSSLIRNITVRHGYANGNGGGIAVSDDNIGPSQNTTITNCHVEKSRGDQIGDGGGIFARSPANLRVNHCTLNDNYLPDGRGGGIAIDDANGVSTYTFSSLVVFNNIANSIGISSTNGGMGGGVFLQGVGTLEQSEVFSNVANMSGGGVTTGSNHSNPLIDRVYIHDNKANVGGGFSIFLTGGATLQNSLLVRNAATSTVPIKNNQITQPFLGGNAIHEPYDGEPDEPLRVINVTIADNKGAADEAIKIEGLANGDNSRRNFFTNVLISGSKVGIRSDGNGFANLTTVLMTNDVVTKTEDFNPSRLTGSAPLTGARGYVSDTDYHLLPSAAGVDQGTTVISNTHDLDGVFRPVGPKYDIGAYETTKTKQTQTITFDNPGDHALANSPFPIHPTASSGLPVQVVSNTTVVCTISATSVTLLKEGTCTLVANQPGNAAFAPAPTVTVTFEVTIAAPKAKLRLPMLENQP